MTTETLPTRAGAPTVLIVPGLRGDVAEHWQVHLQARLPGAVSVPTLGEHERLSCAAQVASLDAALVRITAPVILVAHSGGVITVAHWARSHARAIHGALLAAPPDFDSPLPAGYPSQDLLRRGGWLPVPRMRLPFPHIVAASDDDPLARKARVIGLAQDWGSRVVEVGAVGHLNPASGYGYWPRAEALIQQLI